MVAVDAHGEGKSHQPRGGRDPLFPARIRLRSQPPARRSSADRTAERRANVPDRELGCNGLLPIGKIQCPSAARGAVVGAICTFRDKTEVSQLLQRLDGMMSYVDAPAPPPPMEFMNKLHVILGLLNMKSYRQTRGIRAADRPPLPEADIGDIQHRIKSPVVAGFLISKNSARHRVRLYP